MERHPTRSETHLYVAGLQTARSALITYGPPLIAMLLFLSARVVLGDEAFFRYRVWNIFLVILMIFVVVEWCRGRARVILSKHRLRVAVPLLGDVTLELNGFQEATIIGPGSSHWVPWVGEAFSLLFASVFLILEVYHFLSGASVDPISILFAAVLLVLAFQAHQQRNYKELEMGFGVHSDWCRHVWSQRKVTFRGREEMLQELKRQVEAAAGQGGE